MPGPAAGHRAALQAMTGWTPRHQLEMELTLPFFVASDWHGVVPDGEGGVIVGVVPGGGCDPGGEDG